MTIKFGDVVKLARGRNAWPELRSIVFDGKSAMTPTQLDWVVGVPCPQPNLTAPVVVPVDAILTHLAKSRHLVVMPDHLSNGQGLVTPFNKPKKWDDALVLSLLPPTPETEAVTFDLELDALDRVLIAAGEQDIRYYLNGVLFDLSNGVLVGTDGHRLHMYRNRVPVVYPMKLEGGMCREGGAVEVILHRDPLKWLVHSAAQFAKVNVFNPLREKVNDAPALPGVLLQTDDAFVWVKKPIEGKFPDYHRVVPAMLTRPVWMSLDPVKFADVMGSMAKVARLKSEKYQAVLVDFGEGKVSVDGAQEQVMPFNATLHSDDSSLDLAALAGDLWMGIVPGYVQDLADCVTPAAQWRCDYLNAPNQALLVVDGDFSGVAMPCRVGGPEKAAQAEPVAVPEPAQDDPEEAPPEPCPAAVATMAAQLVTQAQESAKKAPRKAQKARKGPTVGEYIIKAVKDESVTA